MVTIDLLQQAKQYFDLQPPFSLIMLKKAFRVASKKLHPDTSQEDTAREFVRMKACYERLVGLAEADLITGTVSGSMRTIDGVFLSELGLGLGPMKNGVDCSRCEHRGYSEEKGISWDPCSECHGSGRSISVMACRYCERGRFKQKSGRIVTCHVCNGSGEYRILCDTCGGRGSIFNPNGKISYRRCYECKGTGEIEILNPVIPKGRLFARG